MSDSEIEFEIDGKTVKAKPNSMVIQVADEAGIYIPRFCYHKHLSVAANCRMCLVEVEKAPKALPACATPIAPGMKVFTRSPKALAAQKAAMEFLLINHPLDCPICDQGGECELQDLSMGYGAGESYYHEGKRSVKDKNLGPLIASEMTRCIQCTRCVRFGKEVAGLTELGATGRGEHMEIGTYVEKALESEISGNIIDLCPVGALTSKPFRFTARAWELQQFPSIANHDCLGSHINVHTRSGKVMRVVPRENPAINETWLSDRDRFSYEGLHHPDRLLHPLIRVENTWQETDWNTALTVAATQIQTIMNSEGPHQLGALASPNATTEEFYLFQKIMCQLQSPNVDHRLRQEDFSDTESLYPFPGFSASLTELENADVIVLVGSNLQKEQPLAGVRVRKSALQGGKIIALNMMDYVFNFPVTAKQIMAPHAFVAGLNHLTDSIKALLQASKKLVIMVGAQAINHPEASAIRQICQDIAHEYQGKVNYLTEGCNTAGAWLAGVLPNQGLNARELIEQPRKGYLLLNIEPDFDVAYPTKMADALKQATCVVALSLYKNSSLEKLAHVILPITPFTETSGTFINALGEWQSFKGIAHTLGEARPAWKVLRVLGNFLHLEGFDFESSEDVLAEMKNNLSQLMPTKNVKKEESKPSKDTLSRVGEIPLYATDSILRRAASLQATQTIIEGEVAAVRLNPATAEKLQVSHCALVRVTQEDQSVLLPLVIDKRVPDEAAYVPGGIFATHTLGSLFGKINVSPSDSPGEGS